MAGFYNLGNSVFVAVAMLMLGQLGRCIRAQNSPQDYVDSHNNVRSGLGISPLVWDDAVAAYAQSYANQRAGDCEMKHSGGPYGENLYSAWISTGAGYNAADAVNSWVSERDDYDYANNACATGKACGHYTQVVWRNSQRLGCGRVICNNGFTFITCNYDPAGNMNGERPY